MRQAMSKKMNRIIPALMLLLVMTVAKADGAVSWEQLGKSEQQVLQPYAGRWDSMTPEQQQRLQKGAQRWANMSEDERRAASERFQRWQQLPEAQKQRIRERYERFRKLSPEQQQRLRQRMEQFRQLSPEQRQALRQRWQEQHEMQRSTSGAGEKRNVSEPVEEAEKTTGEKQADSVTPRQEPARNGDFRFDRRGMDRMPRGGAR